MIQYTLITGATSGIGLAIARMLTRQHKNLIVSGRNQAKVVAVVHELKTMGGGDIRYYVADLKENNSAQKLYDAIRQDDLCVDTLINNAGVGIYGQFLETDLQQELDMIQVNISSVVSLTKLFAQDMAARGSGNIMNVASLLSFLPFPYYSVYSATKSFVLAFSETIAAEMKQYGVRVTTLCPGPVDTEFNTADMLKTNAYKANKPISADKVAIDAIKLLQRGHGKKIVGFNNWFISNLPRIIPDSIMMKIKTHLASMR